jgi:hypothetical protein
MSIRITTGACFRHACIAVALLICSASVAFAQAEFGGSLELLRLNLAGLESAGKTADEYVPSATDRYQRTSLLWVSKRAHPPGTSFLRLSHWFRWMRLQGYPACEPRTRSPRLN